MNWLPGLARRDAVIPLGVLILGLLFTLLVTATVRETVAGRDLRRFKEIVGIAHTTIEAKMAAYIAMLRAGVGFFNASEMVTAGEFRSFVQGLQPDKAYRGLQGYGFSERVAAAEDRKSVV